ncbi:MULTISPECIES: ABC transporter ATP-binding protein [Halocynthiibacter]|uniref:ABC transporter ATP-binding protein n=1 Tax=Halocynthiibacter halioticoli TaxID=2986804 RepID=A0AAE3LUQ9_9RHOB|nr:MULTISPECIES: ABC transporter ATP-binding protein [Halocynthiibacter]MCV6825345.1 ABC transporter ATP-binding protein [Halocynthiibacter halioticoli]MCW4058346.1 ABC transporter ATP-binding protein [Halocynthiibacter sp. SDUM655004]
MTAVNDLDCINLTKRFDETLAVDDVSFSVPRGSFFSILGPSGCGKTTIMRMIAGFLDPTSGDIQIKGKSVLDTVPNKRPVNMVFQHLALFPMMNIADNIGYGLRRQGLDKKLIDAKVADALERVGLPGIGNRRVEQLSGGQKQRVAIARCMVLEPDVLLLDEPLGALDLKLREHMKVELKSLQAAFDTTFVYITHDQSEALVMSDQVAVMNAGRFEQLDTAANLYYAPQTPFVAGFVGDSNRWKGRVESVSGDQVKLVTETGVSIIGTARGTVQSGATVEAFVRPEAIRVAHSVNGIGEHANSFVGNVENVLFNGANSRVLLRVEGGGTIDVALPQSGEFNGLQRGDALAIGWGASQSLCFGAN